ncbi:MULTISPECIES: MurR/RpiR family transcriptional regulator [Rhizobium]|uniref:DNA-binding MurR/RpiR family transcriptional regulator n=1 Tax=Rhizobium paranaense TaxID=1650438 RepID=A0A7W8XYH5_9HYPH|nr:MurR/RpiR family transcriptional regulator [Rhizobium paranaense]MBB5577900.1 DNA-binding MurR/RpiR family transcriptional regulator [Rhizobium paranaense]
MKAREDTATPATLAELKQLLLRRRKLIPTQAETVLRFALERPDIVAFATAKSLATQCNVAQTTVLRASNLAGFRRFREFRSAFRSYLKNRK